MAVSRKHRVRLNEDPFPCANKMSAQLFERAFNIIDIVAQHQQPLLLKEIVNLTGLHTSTAHRIMSDLVLAGFLEHLDSGHYQLGLRLLELGAIVKERLNIREVAMPAMQWLHQETEQTVNLSVRQGDEIVYIERAENSRSGMQVVRAIGGRAPLHLTSVGKLFLAAAEPRLIKSYASRTGLPGTTPNSIVTLDRLEQEVALVRQYGFARDNEELEIGVRCIAAAVYDNTGKLVAGLSISAPIERMQESWGGLLIRAAATISSALGYGRLV